MQISNIFQFYSNALNQWVVYTTVGNKHFQGIGISIDLALNNLRKKASARQIDMLKEPIVRPAPKEKAAELEAYIKNKMTSTLRL